MPINTYVPIANITLTSAASSVTFSSINSSYTDLVIVCSQKGTASGTYSVVRVGNSSVDTSSNYSETWVYGRYNSAVAANNDKASERYTSQTAWYGTGGSTIPNSSSVFNVNILQIMNYSNTTTYKTMISKSDSVGSDNYLGASRSVHLWRSTSAINTLTISISSGNFDVGSTFSIYGIHGVI